MKKIIFTNENEIKDELNKEKEEEEKVNEKDNQTNNDELLEECSTSFSIENNFLINENIKKENNNKIWKIKENINNCSNQNNLIEKENKNLKKNYWKINNNNNNGVINQQKYFNNNDWILYESLINNNNNQLTKNLSLEFIINQITNIIQKWKLIGQLLISENSNDLEIIYKEQYFGNYICNIEKRICEDNSFYCLLCKDYRTRSIRKIFGRVSTINIDFLGQQFDLILIVLPQQIFNELNNELNKIK
ncbi:PAP_central domain-containing protein [Meloidogyne graminicola]|uniref:PAP_central domain-containing protein n=1 Tax=Meloidogyne graminicola TaxID=189291 RepID=A0A8T0A3X6_9BILA|nr:PAP_central domain-containing protein [Meloidogyne graminicola]